MLKIRDEVDLRVLEKFDYIKFGGLEKEWYFYYYEKIIIGILNAYKIIIDGHTREIKTYKNLSNDISFANVKQVKRNRKIKDLIQAGLVEKDKEGQ